MIPVDEYDECGNGDISFKSRLLRRRLSASLGDLPTTITLPEHISRNCSTCTGCPTGEFRLCRSVEHIICPQSMRDASHTNANALDMCELCLEDNKFSNKKLAKLISQTSDYASSDNSPDVFSNNPLLEALLAQRRPVEENCEENALNNSESEKLLRDLEEKVVFLERCEQNSALNGDTVLSLDSASSWIKSQISAKIAESLSPHGSLEHIDIESQNAVTLRAPLLHSTVSCPSLLTPSIIVNDFSSDHIKEEKDDGRLEPEEEATQSHSSGFFLAIHGLLNSPGLSRRRRASSYSDWSSQTSISTIGSDNDDDSWSCADALPSPSARAQSGWKKVRNVVHWSPFVQTYKKQKYPWIQLGGHQGNFKSGGPGNILKKLTGTEEKCYHLLQEDALGLNGFIPKFIKTTHLGNEAYLEIEDLLAKFVAPAVMDVKMGVRTYLEDELAKAREKPKLRKDMFEKMIQIDPSEPTEEENRLKAVTKPRYMIWRETISSTSSLGFRIEGIKYSDGSTSKEFKTTKSEADISEAFIKFTANNHQALTIYLERLRELRAALLTSTFFKHYELVGSSLLLIHDGDAANFWMIDFAKTHRLPEGINITHNDEWKVGNHEDGYLIGVSSLIRIFERLIRDMESTTK